MLSNLNISRWRLNLLLGCVLFSAPVPLLAQGSGSIKIIEPKKTTQPAKPAMIDTEKFQLGAFLGGLQIEDFGTSAVSGLSGTYQISPDYLVLLHYGSARASKNVIEETLDFNRLPGNLRDLSYWTVSGGYRIYKARSFIGSSLKYDSDIFLTAGLGRMKFAGYTGSGVTLAASYRVVFTDWLVATFDVKDHIYEQLDVFNPESYLQPSDHTKMNQNLEISIGVNALF